MPPPHTHTSPFPRPRAPAPHMHAPAFALRWIACPSLAACIHGGRSQCAGRALELQCMPLGARFPCCIAALGAGQATMGVGQLVVVCGGGGGALGGGGGGGGGGPDGTGGVHRIAYQTRHSYGGLWRPIPPLAHRTNGLHGDDAAADDRPALITPSNLMPGLKLALPSNPLAARTRAPVPKLVLYRGKGMFVFRLLVRMKVSPGADGWPCFGSRTYLQGHAASSGCTYRISIYLLHVPNTPQGIIINIRYAHHVCMLHVWVLLGT